MIDRAKTNGDPALAPEPPAGAPGGLPESLEQRVQRLEDAVAALQDTTLMEDRITDRLLGRMNRKLGRDATAIKSAERHTAAPAPADPPTPAAPETAVEPPPAPPPPPKRSWVILEVFRDVRTMFAMFFDSRFRTSWSAFFALMLLAYVLVSHYLWDLWSGIPLLGLLSGAMKITFVGALLDKAVGLLVALYAFKVLGREMVRYREVISSPPPPYPY
jgi:hypothetical protein